MKINKAATDEQILEWWGCFMNTTNIGDIILLLKQFYEEGDTNLITVRKIYNSQQK